MDKKPVEAWWVRAERRLIAASIAFGVILAAALLAYGLWQESLVLQWAALPLGVVAGVLWGLEMRHLIDSAAAKAKRAE